VLIWDMRAEKRVGLVKLNADDVDVLAFRPDNRQLAVVPGQGGTSINLFDLDAPSLRPGDLEALCARTFGSQYDLFYGVAWTEPAATLSPEGGMIRGLQFSADSRTIKVACHGGSALRLYSRSGRKLGHAKPPDGHKAMTTAVSSRGVAASVVDDSRSILFWNVPRWGDA
jgi:hypothetical protein